MSVQLLHAPVGRHGILYSFCHFASHFPPFFAPDCCYSLPFSSLNKLGEPLLGIELIIGGNTNSVAYGTVYHLTNNVWQQSNVRASERVESIALNSRGELVAVDSHAGNVWISPDGIGDNFN